MPRSRRPKSRRCEGITAVRSVEIGTFAVRAVIESHVARLSEICKQHHITLMPLKGAFMHLRYPQLPYLRPVTDVDVMTAPGSFRRTLLALANAGFTIAPPGASEHERTAAHPSLRLPIDVHESPFPRGRFGLELHDVWARGTPYQPGLRWMAPLDAYAHTLGRMAADHRPSQQARQRQDLEFLAAHERWSPSECAQHLSRCGLARAARAVLDPAGQAPFARATLAALPRDPIGDWLVQRHRSILQLWGESSSLAVASAYALDASLPRAVAAAGHMAAHRARRHVGLQPR